MELKQEIHPNHFFNKLKKHNCKFNKLCGIFPAKCNNAKYIGQLKNFTIMEVFQINDTEADFFKTCFKMFGANAEIKIIKDKE